MESKILFILLQISFLFFFANCLAFAQEVKEGASPSDTYIVHVENPFKHVSALSDEHLERWYSSFLSKSTGSSSGGSGILHSYRHAISGFAAKLTAEDVEEMGKKDGFISARKERVYSLHTTHTPSFLGLHQNLGFWQDSNLGEGMVIGLLDTGITPDHPSFNDEGMPPPPSKWKGKCEGGIVCNNKLIGAKNFVNATEPAIDDDGHGTHTSTTAGGNFVSNANVFGQATGTASGMAPRAHVAMYKVCSDTCSDIAILAAMDAAIEDGVDVISYSIGGGSIDFFDDSFSIAAYNAIQKGIIVSTSAGNDGPENATLSNEAPWVLTVGASTLDRNFRTTVVLGNAEEFDGQSVAQPKEYSSSALSPLVYPGSNDDIARYCGEGSLTSYDVKGKVVMCYIGGDVARIDKGKEVKDAGGVAMILLNTDVQGYSVIADTHVLPVSHVSYEASEKIIEYFTTSSNPEATISFKGTIIGVKDAPAVTHFSSRGPSLTSPGILKPDIIGPGLSIFAAWPISIDNNTNTKATFNVISGTSMSCPHLSGVAALLRKAHPDWSSAAIKSAIMTSADTLNLNNMPIMDEKMNPADVFTLGSGHVNPSKANDPGLVYDIQPEDYIPYLCGLGYTDEQVGMIVQQTITCSQIQTIKEAQLNYPSFAIELFSGSKNYSRTVTNVGYAQSNYDVKIDGVPGVQIVVSPNQLVFTRVNQKMTYQISFIRQSGSPINSLYVEGAITWVCENYAVRSPVSIKLAYDKVSRRLLRSYLVISM